MKSKTSISSTLNVLSLLYDNTSTKSFENLYIDMSAYKFNPYEPNP